MKRILIIMMLLCGISQIAQSRNKVVHIKIDGGIGPATSSYIKNGIETAGRKDAEALIIELNTPGGLLESTRDIVQEILSSRKPVIVYVSPSGGRAGSAGVFITLAAHIAAMAPGTNIGAAHPVGLGGESDSTAMNDKAVNDAAAFVRTIAQKRNRNLDWAERAVRESISSTENEALAEGAIDFISPTIDSLLKIVDGKVVETSEGDVILNTSGADIVYVEMNWREELLALISDPNIAYGLLMLGIYGIMFELYNPGSIFPGVIGGISILLAGYSLQLLPINYAGLALIILAIIMFIIEIKVQSYGMLTIGAVISLLLGSVMLIDSPFEFMRISMEIIITSVVLTTLFFSVIIGLGLRAQRRARATGKEAIIGEIGVAVTDITAAGKGKVRVLGEIWSAGSKTYIPAGNSVKIVAVKGFNLTVEPAGPDN